MLTIAHQISDKFVHMTPYESPLYFLFLMIALIPIIIALLNGKKILWYQNIITLVFLFITFGGPSLKPAFALFVFTLWQLILAISYLKYRKDNNADFVFYLAVIGAILPLFIIKLIPFVQQLNESNGIMFNNTTLSNAGSFIGFLGISYLTFKSVQVVMDLRDGKLQDFKIKDYLQFLLFFPTISSGPIDRFERFKEDLSRVPDKNEYIQMLENGLHKIFIGFLYKFIIAILLNKFLLEPLQETAITKGGFSIELLAVMYVYTLYLFFDFAGYSLFAIGTSKIMGYNTPDNFNKPFISHNIKEFWNRWHMSLSFWFRDYVYMRLMYTLIKNKVFKSRIVASNVGYFVLFILMGLWHGFTWYYLVYGIYHATLICSTDSWLRFKRKHKKQLPSNKLTHAFSVFLTFNAVAFGLLLFSGILDKLI